MKAVSQSDLIYLASKKNYSEAKQKYWYTVTLFDGVETITFFVSAEIYQACSEHEAFSKCAVEFDLSDRQSGVSVNIASVIFA